MKKILLIIGFMLLNYHFGAAQYVTTTAVKTPNGSTVDAELFTGTDIVTNPSDIAGYISYLNSKYGANAVYMGVPTKTYNCHGYTFHVSAGGSNVWINYPNYEIYFNDLSYVRVNNESYATKVVYTGDHSAVRLSSSWYQSKWGADYLVKHTPTSVPNDYFTGGTSYGIPDKYYMKAPSTQISGSRYVNCGDYVQYSLPYIPGATYTWSSDKGYLMSYSNGNDVGLFVKGQGYIPSGGDSDILRCTITTVDNKKLYTYTYIEISCY